MGEKIKKEKSLNPFDEELENMAKEELQKSI